MQASLMLLYAVCIIFEVESLKRMSNVNILYKVWRFYSEGFRQMTVGKTLWVLIIVKLIVIFVILKWLFFPDYVGTNAEQGKEAEFVAGEVLGEGNYE